jgi:pimeloyl-ACP methyl ester carboxylesterase
VTVSPAGVNTSTLDGPNGSLEFVTTGSGLPATVFAHGLAGSIQATRPFGSGVRGSRTFMHFRGHGASTTVETTWTYAGLADELRAVGDHVGATQALGVSMGAGALCSLLARTPLRFERLVFVMPAVLDRPRTDDALGRLVEMARCVDLCDVEGLTALLLEGEPVVVRAQPDVQLWCRRRAAALVGTPVSGALRALPTAVPLTDRGVLAAVTVPALVIAQEQDPAHPVWVAEQIAASLPHAHLEVMASGGIMWRHRAAMRDLIGGFLSGEPHRQSTRLSQSIGGR